MKIELPFLAEGIEGGDVVTVLVNEGDAVAEGQSILELETDKATVPVPSPAAGKIAKVLVRSGDHVKVGQALLELDGAAEPASPQGAEPKPAKTTAAKPAEPPTANRQPPTAPAEDEVGVRQPSPQDEARQMAQAGPNPTGDENGQAATQAVPLPVAPAPQAPGSVGANVAAAPSVRRLARELGVDLSQVKGTEAGGRITAEDVKAYVRERSRRAESGVGAPAKRENVFTTLYGNERREAMPSIRRKIAANMANAWSTIPHVYQFFEADVTDLLALQKRYGAKFKERGAQLTMTSLLIKAVLHALKLHPKFNANVDITNGEIVYKEYYNIGVAVDTPHGLIVPVIHNVDQKDLFQMATELADLAQRTRERQVKLEEIRGGTFTISNLGGLGAGPFTPIINPPEVAILGVGRSKIQPVHKDGKFVPRSVLPLCIAYDHRLIDGADGARFAADLAKVLEDYEAMFLGL